MAGGYVEALGGSAGPQTQVAEERRGFYWTEFLPKTCMFCVFSGDLIGRPYRFRHK